MSRDLTIPEQPGIVKYTASQHDGVTALKLSRSCIGYVLRGRKCIHYGDLRYEISRGDIFFLNVGTYYVEDIPEEGKPFEQIAFYYQPDKLSDILSILSRDFGLVVKNDHQCERCNSTNHAICHTWPALKDFFSSVNHYIREDVFSENKVIEKLCMTELVTHILSNQDCCIKVKILNNIESSTESFERTVQLHVFSDISIETLAELCGKSVTLFKKDFRKHFHDSPHRWIIRQRLTHARMLLISTTRSVADIGNECIFPNTSHFIKLFKKEFGYTPASYRAISLREGEPAQKSKQKTEKAV